MNFRSTYIDGWATFYIGEETFKFICEPHIFEKVSTLANAACRHGAHEAVRGMASRFAEWAREEEMK